MWLSGVPVCHTPHRPNHIQTCWVMITTLRQHVSIACWILSSVPTCWNARLRPAARARGTATDATTLLVLLPTAMFALLILMVAIFADENVLDNNVDRGSVMLKEERRVSTTNKESCSRSVQKTKHRKDHLSLQHSKGICSSFSTNHLHNLEDAQIRELRKSTQRFWWAGLCVANYFYARYLPDLGTGLTCY